MVIVGMPRMVCSPRGQSWEVPVGIHPVVAARSPPMVDRQGNCQKQLYLLDGC
jgi:hypothetical protein